MKLCPKCDSEHNKPGTYCSRACANSRIQTADMNQRRSAKLIGKVQSREYPQKGRKLTEDYKKNRLLETPFDDLGLDSKRLRILLEQNDKCAECNTSHWRDVKLSLEMDHIDGDRANNSRSNLVCLCPNCHSITPTWRGRNKRSQKITDEALLVALQNHKTIRQALIAVGIAPKGNNYARAKKLLEMAGPPRIELGYLD